MQVEVGKRYTSGFVNILVKEINENLLSRDYNDQWVTSVICDTPSTTKDVVLPLTDIQDHFEEDTDVG